MSVVPGTRGYEEDVDAFVRTSQALDFAEINSDFLEFLPAVPSRVLDAGAGAGQNAAALAQLGYEVIAVEPLLAFIEAARSAYEDLNISWIQDSLPELRRLKGFDGGIDFILCDGVWHHLDEQERERCMARFAELMRDGGVCAISLRSGPAGVGKHVFPTNGRETVALASECGLGVVFYLEDQPSKMANKPEVTWTRLVLKKQGERHGGEGKSC